MHPFDLSPILPQSTLIEPEPDRLQGWSHPWLYDLSAPHRVPALLELSLMRAGAISGRIFSIRGTAVTLGRYAPETGPVDIDLGVLPEHERLRVGLPHLRIGRDSDGWWIEPMTMFYPTELDGVMLSAGGARLKDGAVLTVGDVHFKVNYGRDADKNPAAERPLPPCLRLKRDGATTGINIPLSPPSMTFGRSSPLTGEVDCDLSALPDAERVYLGRQHARFLLDGGRWYVEPTGRAPIFINRQPPLQQTHQLMTGDEVGLGNVLLTFMGSASMGELFELDDDPDTTDFGGNR